MTAVTMSSERGLRARASAIPQHGYWTLSDTRIFSSNPGPTRRPENVPRSSLNAGIEPDFRSPPTLFEFQPEIEEIFRPAVTAGELDPSSDSEEEFTDITGLRSDFLTQFVAAWNAANLKCERSESAKRLEFKRSHDYDAILNPGNHFDGQRILRDRVTQSCWSTDLLPASSISFSNQGIMLRYETLFDSALFLPSSPAVIPSVCTGRIEGRDAIEAGFIHDLSEEWQVDIALTAILASMQMLQDYGFSCGDFNVISQDRNRETVASLLNITYLSHRLLTTTWRERDSITAGEQCIAKADVHVEGLLSKMGVDTSNVQGGSLQTVQKLKAYVRLSMLSLVSYIGSHCEDFRPDVWPDYTPPTVDSAPDMDDTVVFQQMPLACSNGDIGGPLFMFRTGPVAPQALSLYLVDYADLWGPLWAKPDEISGDVSVVHTEQGLLYRRPSPAPFAHDEEVTCHWITTRLSPCINGDPFPGHKTFMFNERRTLTTDREEMLPAAPLPFPATARLLLGHPSTRTELISPRNTSVGGSIDLEPEPRDRTHRMTARFHERDIGDHRQQGLFESDDCDLKKYDLVESKVFNPTPINTGDAQKVPDSFTIGLSAGYYLTATGSRTYKHIPKRTRKQSIIGQCKMKTPGIEWLKLLSLQIGLEVSWCTWNARRTSLWQALKLAFSFPESDHCRHGIGDPACVLKCWKGHFTASFVRQWEVRLKELECGYKARRHVRALYEEFLSEVMPRMIPLLECTGVDEEDTLHVYWPGGSFPETVKIPLESAPWLRIIRETPLNATFAVFNPICLGYKGPLGSGREIETLRRCCELDQWIHGKPPHDPVLQTQIEIKRATFGSRDCELFCWDKNIGVAVGSELPLSSGGSLIFRNKQRHCQLALYQAPQTFKDWSHKYKSKIRGHSEDELQAKELQDYRSASSYRVSVIVF